MLTRHLFALYLCLSAPCLLPTRSPAQAPADAKTPAAVPAAATAPISDGITPQMRADDARLNTPVTLDAPRLALGELLEKLAAQSGVALTMDAREPLSGLQVFVVCDKTPLGDVLDRLWSLLSFQHARWKWERSGNPGVYHYQFAPTRAAVDFPASMNTLAQTLFETHARTMMEIADLPPGERKTRVPQISATLLQKEDRLAQALTAEDNFNWYVLRVFAHALTPEQQKMVLNRGSIQLTVASLPPETQDTFHAGWKVSGMGTVAPDGQRIPMPEPPVITLECQAHHAVRCFVAPLWLTFATSATGGAGTGVLGFGLETPLRDMTRDLWMLPGDSKANPLAERVCAKPANPIPELPPAPKSLEEFNAAVKQGRRFDAAHAPPKLQHRFGQLAHALPMMILAVLPEPINQGYDLDTPYDKTVQAFLAQGAFNPGADLMVKWRGDALLVHYPTWLLDSDRCYPYALTQQIEKISRTGFIPYTDLAQIAAQVNARQWQDLCLRTPLLNDLSQALPLLQMCAAYPTLLREDGLLLTDVNRPALQAAFNTYHLNILQNGKAAAIRARTIRQNVENIPQLQLAIEYRDAEKTWRIFSGYAQKQVGQP